MGFYSPDFTFDGISNKEMGVIMVTMDSSGVLSTHGQEYQSEMVMDYSIGYADAFYYGVTHQIVPMDFTISLVDEVGNPQSWTVDERIRILRWLKQSDFKAFTTEDNPEVIYYLKCTNVKKDFNADMKGTLTVTMQPSSPYAFTPWINQMCTNADGLAKNIMIDNVSNLDEKYYPILEIVSHQVGQTISIINDTTGETAFTITDLVENEVVTIDGLMKYIESSTGENRLMNSNRKWFYLNQDINSITITGKCDINFKCQYPLIV